MSIIYFDGTDPPESHLFFLWCKSLENAVFHKILCGTLCVNTHNGSAQPPYEITINVKLAEEIMRQLFKI